ncbi:hypothetical protein ACFXGA_35375 [Actinosynnema sp. NPDC059335]|uniref:vWA domain-containing protein n=1 Tax=Actinosynnema sp. NPDC059335 TaxID=3346804 RepID=UPI0036707895
MRRVMPIYLAVNSSPSMAGRLPEVGQLLDALADELLYSPLLGERVRLCLVTFSDTARCVLPLSDLTEGFPRPPLTAGRRTLFAPVFDLLGKLIGADASAHVASGITFDRPLVVLITDGVPLDRGWQRSFDRFYQGSHPRTLLVAVGLDPARAHELGGLLLASDVRVLDDTADQPLAAQVRSLLSNHLDALTTSRMIVRPEDG